MSVPKIFDNIVNFMSGAVSRIFGLDDDNYPNTGVQPYSGDRADKKHRSD